MWLWALWNSFPTEHMLRLTRLEDHCQVINRIMPKDGLLHAMVEKFWEVMEHLLCSMNFTECWRNKINNIYTLKDISVIEEKSHPFYLESLKWYFIFIQIFSSCEFIRFAFLTSWTSEWLKVFRIISCILKAVNLQSII
jgi:hypothetical protein